MEPIATILLVILFLALIAFFVWLYVRILHKAGFSGWWTLLLFIPLVNLIMMWIFAFADWPALKKNSATTPTLPVVSP